MTQRRRAVKIVIPLSELLKLEDPPAPAIAPCPSIQARVVQPPPKIDWITIIGCTCIIVITVAAVLSALRQKKSVADRGYGA